MILVIVGQSCDYADFLNILLENWRNYVISLQ